MKIIVTDVLPLPPTPGEEARRIVRHGMADIIRQLPGEGPVGPAPDALKHVVVTADGLLVSPEFRDNLTRPFRQLAAAARGAAQAMAQIQRATRDDFEETA